MSARIAKREIYTELEAIRAGSGGLLQSRAVINRARDKSSPLHSHFEWDDTIAGERYRHIQARELIANCTLEIESPEQKTVRVRAYYSLPSDRGVPNGGYRVLADILDDDHLTKELIEMALGELETFQAKYDKIAALRPVFQAVESVKKKNRKKKR